MSETIALFGGTGGTGSHFLKLALKAGYKVQAMVRTPAKVTEKDPKLTLVEGDFENRDAIATTVKGATYVVCMAGYRYPKGESYPKDLMLNLAKTITAAIQSSAPSVKVFLYQAGALAATPDTPLSCGMRMMRQVAGTMVGIKEMIFDNEKVLFYLAEQKETLGFSYIVTRPGMIEEKEGGKVKLVANHESSQMGGVAFYDLAVFSLAAIKDASLYGTYPYPVVG